MLAQLAYHDQSREVAGKAFDFSPETTTERWRAERDEMTAFPDQIDPGRIAIGTPGLTIIRDINEAMPASDTFHFKITETAG